VADRFVVVGLARSRARWFGELTRWADAAVAPVDFVKCLTPEEARAVLGAGRTVSALLVDDDLPRFDRDLVADAERAGVPTVLIGRAGGRDWEALGCATRLDPDFGRDELVDVLDRFAKRVSREAGPRPSRVDLEDDPARGALVGVIGAGGAGTSTVAIALAQAWAADGADTVLVDGCRRADQAMYHDVGDVIPGFPELVDLHRSDEPDPTAIRDLELDTSRGYRLVLGLRRTRDWAGLRPRAVAAAFRGLRRTHDAVVVDLEPDLDDEAQTGSIDVEDRHAATLAVARDGDAVVVVGRPDLKGAHDAVRLVHDLVRSGTPAERIAVVVNQAPRSAPARARLARTIRSLTGDEPGAVGFLRRIRRADALHHDVATLPDAFATDVLRTTRAVLGRSPSRTFEPVRIRVGELGTGLVLDEDGSRR
jgi:MinD-like ATPase involved in chromosome partitioning or flagellar assembly